MQIFKDDDAGYVAWRDAHQHGYIVNCARDPKPNYLVLHRGSCWTVNKLRTGYRHWTDQYIKVCLTDEGELRAWARTHVSPFAQFTSCKICTP